MQSLASPRAFNESGKRVLLIFDKFKDTLASQKIS